MKKHLNILVPILALFLAVGAVKAIEIIGTPQEVKELFEQTEQEQNLGSVQFVQSKTILDAVSATTTSSVIDIEGAKRVTLLLSTNIPNVSTASTTFDVDVSLDGTTFVDYNKLVENLANANSTGLTRIGSKAFTATSTGYMVSLDLVNDVYSSMRITATLIEPQGAADITDATAKALIIY